MFFWELLKSSLHGESGTGVLLIFPQFVEMTYNKGVKYVYRKEP